jgi:hypothetical protein
MTNENGTQSLNHGAGSKGTCETAPKKGSESAGASAAARLQGLQGLQGLNLALCVLACMHLMLSLVTVS